MSAKLLPIDISEKSQYRFVTELKTSDRYDLHISVLTPKSGFQIVPIRHRVGKDLETLNSRALSTPLPPYPPSPLPLKGRGN